MSSIFTNQDDKTSEKNINQHVTENFESSKNEDDENVEKEEDNVIRSNDDIDLNDKSNTKTWEGQGDEDPNANEMNQKNKKKKLEGVQEGYEYMYSFQKKFCRCYY